MIWVNWPFNVCIVSHICIKIKEIDTKLVQITTTLTHLTNVYQQQTASDEDWEPHSLFFCSLSSFVSMWPLQENERGWSSGNNSWPSLLSPSPHIHSQWKHLTDKGLYHHTRLYVCVFLPARHAHTRCFLVPWSLFTKLCARWPHTHTHAHSLLTTHGLPSWLCFLFLSFEAVPHYEDTMGSSVCLGQ